MYDNDPVKRVQAHALGYRTSASTTEAVRDAELVLCATGSLALRYEDFAALRNGAYLGSVTSSEDELELDSLHDLYERRPAGDQLTRYEVTGHYFYVLADGGAVNFVHGAAVGTYILLVQAEILAATAALSHARLQPGLHEMPAAKRHHRQNLAPPLRKVTPLPPSTDHIRAVTEAYLARHPDERGSLTMLFAALASADDLTSRKTFPAHVTCSAILINGEQHVLHIAHKASGKLLAPGGHNEPSDQHLRDAALRELHEEAGIPPSAVVPLAGHEDVPLDIDVHAIDANPSKNEPAHHHVDFRWAFHLGAEHAVTLQEEEVDGYQWRPFATAASPTVRAKLAQLT